MRRATTCLTICLAALLALAPLARAAYDPLGGGQARLLLDKRFARFLKADGISLKAKRGARHRGSAYLLPVSGGVLDPTEGKGSIETEGVLVFTGAKRDVPLRNLTLKTKHSPLIAKVGGSQLKLAHSPRLSFKRGGFDSTFAAAKLKLTAKLVTRLNKKLRPKAPFKAGQPLGTILATAAPRLTAIEAKGSATLVFNPAFVAKLDQRFVSLNPIFPAEHQGATFTFPIQAGGSLSPEGSEGELRTEGAVELLQLGAGQVFWKELWLDFGSRADTAEADVEPAPAFPGKLGRIGVMDLGAATVTQDPASRTISVSGAPLTLSASSADTFDEAFDQGEGPSFEAGEAAATLSFVAQGQ